jgi:Trypsin
MARGGAAKLTLLYACALSAAGLLAVAPAGAVVLGSSSSLDYFTVRIVGRGQCSGVVIARRAVATAAHCARHGARVITGSGSVRVVGASRSARLDDGRRAYASGDAVILQLAEPLPSSVGAAPIGRGDGDSFTIAGYGTTDERAGGAFGSLHEARLVRARGRALVDPNRSSGMGASACFGDSGGPVLRGGELVGVITRANYPHKRIACGFYTRWAPIAVSGRIREAVASNDHDTSVFLSPKRARSSQAR